jgi:glycerol-3-phosphate acyltransferase PlsX
MGSESSPLVLFAGVLKAALNFPDLIFFILGTQSVIEQIKSHADFIPFLEKFSASIKFQTVSQVIEMDDDPLISVRQKRNSSLVVGLSLLKEQQVDGFVTSGNTGALIVASTLFIPLLNPIKRPALLANLPTMRGKVSIIDVGGTVRARANHLMQFAQMGIAYQNCCLGINCPKVGLLNVGMESKKGTAEVRKTYHLLNEMEGIDFVGNVEGREVFQGIADVLITDGFAGNVLLKTAEGVYAFIVDQLKHVLQSLPIEQQGLIYRELQVQFDYEEYMGAIVCGIDGLVVKCHGSSSSKGMYNAINGAVEAIQNQYIRRIKERLSL